MILNLIDKTKQRHFQCDLDVWINTSVKICCDITNLQVGDIIVTAHGDSIYIGQITKIITGNPHQIWKGKDFNFEYSTYENRLRSFDIDSWCEINNIIGFIKQKEVIWTPL